ncbi:MAG: hypothetical protein DRZ76_01750 [Candidatus Nealsonbacteria bacterium]|nr:MAG: hypothetical protein DRZ76_01750 [Candidatus Nealsonbacteria bacterium]
MNYEVMKAEPLVWHFSRPINYMCPVCGREEANTKVFLAGDDKSTIQMNTCHTCSRLDGTTIVGKAIGGGIIRQS